MPSSKKQLLPDVDIQRGWFWSSGPQDNFIVFESDITTVGGTPHIKVDRRRLKRNHQTLRVDIHHNVFWLKPKWYEIKKWWVAFNMWRKL